MGNAGKDQIRRHSKNVAPDYSMRGGFGISLISKKASNRKESRPAKFYWVSYKLGNV